MVIFDLIIHLITTGINKMTINLKAFMKQVARAWGYPWTWLFMLILCSCEVQEQNFIEAVELQGSQWI